MEKVDSNKQTTKLDEKVVNEEKKVNEEKTWRKKQIKILKIILAVLVVAILIGVTAYFIPIMRNLSTPEGRIAFKDKVQNSGPMGMLSLFGLQVAQVFLFILPGEPIEIVAGMCYGGIWGTVFVIASATIISTAIFFLVRKLGNKFVYEFCDEEKVKKIENNKLFQDPKRIEIIMLILFLIPGTPKDLLVYIAGLLPIKPLSFILISTLARIPSVASSTFAGAKIVDGNFKMAGVIYGAIIAVVVAVIFVVNKFDKSKVTEEAMRVIK